MKKIRAKLLSTGNVLVSVTTSDRTPKGYTYGSTDHHEISATDAEVLLYDLHTVVQTLRGAQLPAKRWRRLVGKALKWLK